MTHIRTFALLGALSLCLPPLHAENATLLGFGDLSAAGVGVAITDPNLEAEAGCVRKARTITYHGSPANVFASPDQWAELVFPQTLVGELIEQRDGIEVRRPPNFRDRAFVQVTDPTYLGTVFFHDIQGNTYHLRILARRGCADSSVTITRMDEPASSDSSPGQADEGGSASGTQSARRNLLEAMISGGEPPRGYHKEHLTGPMHDRMVFRQGPVSFYVKEMWVGRRETGTILFVENDGRTPYRVAIEAINYQSPEVRRLLGRVREVSMLPTDLRLGPTPEYAADIYHPTHQGLIFIISEREAARVRR